MTISHAIDEDGDAERIPTREEMGYDDDSEPLKDASERENSVRQQQRRHVVTAEAEPISYRPGFVSLYSPPRQRQKWGDTQVLPRTNSGDLFFDLFYVAATYKVSYVLTEKPDWRGGLYAAATFLPVLDIWTQKTFYDGRFVYEDDLYHRLWNLALLVVLARAVLHIRPVNYMSHPEKYMDTFIFSLMLLVERMLTILAWLENYFFGVGQRKALKSGSLMYIGMLCIPTAFHLAACILSGLAYVGSDDESDYHRRLAGDGAYPYSNDTAYTIDGYSSEDGATDLPILLVFLGHVCFVAFSAGYILCFFPGGGRHKELAVPVNVDFIMHRYGEWTILMLGESVFSLLIEEIPSDTHEFYGTFISCLLCVVLLFHLHFSSQPHDPDGHALRRHKNAGICWSILNQLYSFVLVALGAAFTFFLRSFAYEDSDGHRRGLAASSTSHGTSQYDANKLFCTSLAVVFFSLDAQSLAHMGLRDGYGRCHCPVSKKLRVGAVILPTLRLMVLAFTATLHLWEERPLQLSILGLMCVCLQLAIRRMGAKFSSSFQQVHAVDAKH